MNIKIVKDNILKKELEDLAEETYFPMIKAVVDIENNIVAFGGEYHNDANLYLQAQTGSKQENIWGFNIYLDQPKESWLEFNSLINIRPTANNRSMDIENEEIQGKIKKIIDNMILC